jgi:excisionase family DNA binding protein
MPTLIRDIEAADRLGIPVRRVLQLVDDGRLTGYARDERVWVNVEELDELDEIDTTT